MGKGILNRGTQVHRTNKKNMKKFVLDEELDMEETYKFQQIRTYMDRDDLSGKNYKVDDVKVQFDAETLPEVLDQIKYFLVSCGYTYINSISATSKLDETIWNSSEERV